MADEVASWRRAVDQLLRAGYMISLNDVGLDDDDVVRFVKSEPSPAEFVGWFARKYDLDHC